VSPGYGFAAIIVAFVGRLHPVGILFASLLMSLLYLGGESAQMGLALPSAVTGLFQGTLLFFLLASDVFINYRLRMTGGPKRRRDDERRHGADQHHALDAEVQHARLLGDELAQGCEHQRRPGGEGQYDELGNLVHGIDATRRAPAQRPAPGAGTGTDGRRRDFRLPTRSR
jgi:hypothetical protein